MGSFKVAEPPTPSGAGNNTLHSLQHWVPPPTGQGILLLPPTPPSQSPMDLQSPQHLDTGIDSDTAAAEKKFGGLDVVHLLGSPEMAPRDEQNEPPMSPVRPQVIPDLDMSKIVFEVRSAQSHILVAFYLFVLLEVEGQIVCDVDGLPDS